jgi:hypothetical protein
MIGGEMDTNFSVFRITNGSEKLELNVKGQ